MFFTTEWFFAAICYSSIKQIIYSQVIKITKKQEHAGNVTSDSCTISTNEEIDPLWKHLFLKSLQDSYISLPGQVLLQLGKEISMNSGSAPECEVDGSLTQVQLWLQFSKALKFYWLLQWNTSVFCRVPAAEVHLGLNTMVDLIFQGMLSVLSIY